MDFMGVPPEDESLMVQITNALFSGDDDEINEAAAVLTPAEQAEQMRAAFKPMEDYFAALTRDRIANPREDVATLIANGRVTGEPLPPDRALGHYLSFATAGQDRRSVVAGKSGQVRVDCGSGRTIKKKKNQ